MASLLFTYGTLRPDLADRLPAVALKKLIPRLENSGRATVAGYLYDLGDYPGLILSPDRYAAHGDEIADIVTGDLLAVDEEALVMLDEYEECNAAVPLYRREQVLVRRIADGEPIVAWTYVYCGQTQDAFRIRSGDYVQHRLHGAAESFRGPR